MSNDNHGSRPRAIRGSKTLKPDHDTVKIEVPGPLLLLFPTSLFLPSGQLEHRLHRSRFLQQMALFYDENAEKARLALNQQDPATLRPPLERLGMLLVDTQAIAAAAAEDDEGKEESDGEEDSTPEDADETERHADQEDAEVPVKEV